MIETPQRCGPWRPYSPRRSTCPQPTPTRHRRRHHAAGTLHNPTAGVKHAIERKFSLFWNGAHATDSSRCAPLHAAGNARARRRARPAKRVGAIRARNASQKAGRWLPADALAGEGLFWSFTSRQVDATIRLGDAMGSEGARPRMLCAADGSVWKRGGVGLRDNRRTQAGFVRPRPHPANLYETLGIHITRGRALYARQSKHPPEVPFCTRMSDATGTHSPAGDRSDRLQARRKTSPPGVETAETADMAHASNPAVLASHTLVAGDAADSVVSARAVTWERPWRATKPGRGV